MLKLDEIKQQVQKDLQIDKRNPSFTAANIPLLHSKYLDMLNTIQLLCIELKAQYDVLYREKYLYYRNDFAVIPKNKAEIDVLIDGDEDVQKLKKKLDYYKTVAGYLESVMKQISSMPFLVRDFIEWEKFKAGC